MPNISSKKTPPMKKLSVCKISNRNSHINFKGNSPNLFLKKSFKAVRQCFHQQILKQSAVGVSSIMHFTDGEMETLGRGAACLHLHHSPAAE